MGPTPLFDLISNQQWEDVATRVKYYPKELKQVTKLRSGNNNNSNKILPLHHLCSLNPSLEVTEAILKTYPKAAQNRDSLFKRLPIHVMFVWCVRCSHT